MSYDVKGNIIWLHGGGKKKNSFLLQVFFSLLQTVFGDRKQVVLFSVLFPPTPVTGFECDFNGLYAARGTHLRFITARLRPVFYTSAFFARLPSPVRVAAERSQYLFFRSLG